MYLQLLGNHQLVMLQLYLKQNKLHINMCGMNLLKLGIKQLDHNFMGVVDINKNTLSEIDLYHGNIAMPKGFEINRDRIKSDILTSFINQKRINNNPKAYAYKDYQV